MEAQLAAAEASSSSCTAEAGGLKDKLSKVDGLGGCGAERSARACTPHAQPTERWRLCRAGAVYLAAALPDAPAHRPPRAARTHPPTPRHPTQAEDAVAASAKAVKGLEERLAAQVRRAVPWLNTGVCRRAAAEPSPLGGPGSGAPH